MSAIKFLLRQYKKKHYKISAELINVPIPKMNSFKDISLFHEKGNFGDLTHSPSTRQISQVLTNALFTSANKAARVVCCRYQQLMIKSSNLQTQLTRA